jgi:acyl-CoA thioesterase II
MTDDNSETTSPLTHLQAVLDITQLTPDHFSGFSSKGGWGRVYGGQVLAQAMVAATRTVDSARIIHSLHGYFLIAGDPKTPIEYTVERLRDGGSFSTRQVKASQGGQAIFSMIGSFHKAEPGFEHATPMPDVPPPEALMPMAELFAQPSAQIPPNMRAYYHEERPFEIRLTDTRRYFGGTQLPGRQSFWLKTKGRLPDDPTLHRALLAFASDFAMIDTALIAHGRMMFDPKLQLASLDHALWINRPFRVDDWLLYVLESPSAGQGRGLTRGSFYTQAGVLVASVAQEGLMRERKTAFVIK